MALERVGAVLDQVWSEGMDLGDVHTGSMDGYLDWDMDVDMDMGLLKD